MPKDKLSPIADKSDRAAGGFLSRPGENWLAVTANMDLEGATIWTDRQDKRIFGSRGFYSGAGGAFDFTASGDANQTSILAGPGGFVAGQVYDTGIRATGAVVPAGSYLLF